jgi:hypothetical protein
MADRKPSPEAGELGQASVELIAGLPLLIAVALLCLQLLATGYASTLADGAVEAAALALVADRPTEAAVHDALPGWARDRIALDREGGRLTVSLEPPALLPMLGRALEVSSTAWVRRPMAGR